MNDIDKVMGIRKLLDTPDGIQQMILSAELIQDSERYYDKKTDIPYKEYIFDLESESYFVVILTTDNKLFAYGYRYE